MKYIRYCFILSVLFLTGNPVSSHPSWGIAIDTKGTIYFADILHNGIGTIWKIDPAGQVSELLTDFHAHDLQMDAEGNLWVAEDRWIQGVIEGEGQQTLLKITPEGKKQTIIFTEDRDEFFGGSFALGPDSSVYFPLHKRIWKKAFNGNTSLLIDHQFERIVTLYTDEHFNLWITDKGHKQGTLYKWNKDIGLVEYVTALLPTDPDAPIFEEERFQLLYGITSDKEGFIYVTESADRSVRKINQDSRHSVFYTSEETWYPAGIAFHEGNAYIMEVGYERGHEGPRIISINPEGELEMLFDYEAYQKRRGK
jgi:sugar lactone lactonase YvrE